MPHQRRFRKDIAPHHLTGKTRQWLQPRKTIFKAQTTIHILGMRISGSIVDIAHQCSPQGTPRTPSFCSLACSRSCNRRLHSSLSSHYRFSEQRLSSFHILSRHFSIQEYEKGRGRLEKIQHYATTHLRLHIQSHHSHLSRTEILEVPCEQGH